MNRREGINFVPLRLPPRLQAVEHMNETTN